MGYPNVSKNSFIPVIKQIMGIILFINLKKKLKFDWILVWYYNAADEQLYGVVSFGSGIASNERRH
jgi:hypothetical protein